MSDSRQSSRPNDNALPQRLASGSAPPIEHAIWAAAGLGFIGLDASGCCVAWSSTAANVTGVTLNVALGRPFLELLAPSSRVRVSQLIDDARDGIAGVAHRVEFERSEPGVECRLAFGARDDATPAAAPGVVVWGLVERVAAPASVEDAAVIAVLAKTLDHATDLFALHRGGRLMYLNAAARARLRLREGTPYAGLEMLSFVHPDDRATAEDRMRRAMAGERFLSPVEIRMVVESSEFVVETTSTRVELPGMDPCVMAFARDMTSRRLADSQAMQSERLATLGMLAASVAHDINNPLAALGASLDVLSAEIAEGGAHDDPVRAARVAECLADAREAARRMRETSNDLRSFSRPSDDPPTAVNVHALLESAARLASNEIRHRATLVKHFGPVPPVLARESRLVQVFVNLLANAAQAIPSGQVANNSIRVRTYCNDAGAVVVDVEDTGVGIAPEVAEKLFHATYTTKPRGAGTGLGLIICHRIVSELGGRLEVSSEVGRGSVLRVVLPAADVPAAPARPRSVVPPLARTDSPPASRVLIVDDEAATGRALARLIGRDHLAVVVTSAAEAWAAIEASGDFAVIFCDLMMPDVSGTEFHRRLSSQRPALAERTVFVTGGVFHEDVLAYVTASGCECLDKPFDPPAVRATLARFAP